MTTTTSNPAEVGRAVVLAAIGIGLYSVMDALMKSLAVQLGAYNAALWRGLIGCAITGLIYLARRKSTPKVGAAAFASAAFLVLSTAYAKAETKVLVSLEYSAFLWAALFGWLMFKEPVTVATLGGAVLIVAACLYAATGQHHPLPEAEIGL